MERELIYTLNVCVNPHIIEETSHRKKVLKERLKIEYEKNTTFFSQVFIALLLL